jgi:hypothetical protein
MKVVNMLNLIWIGPRWRALACWLFVAWVLFVCGSYAYCMLRSVFKV